LIIDEPTPSPEPIYSSILSCVIMSGLVFPNAKYYHIYVSAGDHLLDTWSMSGHEFHNNICSDTVRDYQESYFLPFVHAMHARLQHVIIYGDT